MSKKLLYTIKDVKAEAYLPIVGVRAKGEAIRIFSDEANNPSSPIGQHPADFILFAVGYFDELTGMIDAHAPEAVGNGSDFLKATE